MGLDENQRQTVVDLLHVLGPEQDAGPLMSFFHSHKDECIAELTVPESPDVVRAALIRLLPAVVEEPERAELLGQVKTLLQTLEGEAVNPMLRHPAWLGLCWLETLSQLDDPRAEQQSVESALQAFHRIAPTEEVAEGEAAWAMAEVAEEAGWTDWVDSLMGMAVQAPFASEENLGKVRLIQLLRMIEAEHPDALEAAGEVIDMDVLDTPSRIHALWVGALLAAQIQDVERALEWLQQAEALAIELGDGEIVDKVRQMIAAIRGGGGPAAQAK